MDIQHSYGTSTEDFTLDNTSQYGHCRSWEMKNGNKIMIADMTDSHLQNTIRMLERKIDGSMRDEIIYDYIISMKNELKKRRKGMIQNVDLKVVGVTFKNDDTGESRRDIILELAEQYSGKEKDIKIELKREPSNKYDINAIMVFADDRQIGYIGKDYASILAPQMDEYTEFTGVVKGIGMYNKRPYCEITLNQV